MRVKKGDTYPLRYQLLQPDNVPYDLTGAATVEFRMIADKGTTPVAGGTCSIETEGWVSYPWKAEETETIGMYKGEFVIAWSDGTILTLPIKEALWIWIMENAGGVDGP